MGLFCPGELPLWRVRAFFEKEPETIDWMDTKSLFWRGEKTLKDPRVKSVLIELNEKGMHHQEICDYMLRCSFRVASTENSEMMKIVNINTLKTIFLLDSSLGDV